MYYVEIANASYFVAPGKQSNTSNMAKILFVKCFIQVMFETMAIFEDDVDNLMDFVRSMLNDDSIIENTIEAQINDDRSRFAAIMRLQRSNEDLQYYTS